MINNQSDNQAMHQRRRSAANFNHSFLAATWVIAAVRQKPQPFSIPQQEP